MKILICYSKYHFDPNTTRCLTHSASFIARAIYETAQEFGEVTYIDPSEARSISRQSFDLFIGQINQFSNICCKNRINYRILFMATTHPSNRNRVLQVAAKQINVPISETLQAKKDTFTRADLILQVGSDWALSALLKAGINRSKILNIHYGIQHIPFNHKRDFSQPYKFLFLATELGLRKGIINVLDTFVNLEGDYQLTLVGGTSSQEYMHRIHQAVAKNNRIQHVGWVDSSTEAYRQILDNHHFIFFPSIEEGEAGTVLEGLCSGLVPIISRERVGVDYSPLGDFVLNEDNCALLKRAMTLSPDELETLSRQGRHYVDTVHSWLLFKNRLRDVFEKILAGHLFEIIRPKVNLILPVFNKESNIVRLLKQLYKTTRSYGNFDLHLFFDGCMDRSQERARGYLGKCDINVRYYETPNLFETRTNNIGLRAADGKYCVLLQDDLYLYEDHWLEKFVYFMETNPCVGALGGLAGVNYFPSEMSLSGPGASNYSIERSRRIDVLFDPKLYEKAHEVDAVMRGPIMLRKALLEKYGYLDEDHFAPFYQDDMDLCFRLRQNGYSVFYYPISVVNEGSTISRYQGDKQARWQSIIDRHLQLFYERWKPDGDKSSYLTLPKPSFNNLFNPRHGKNGYHLGKRNKPSKSAIRHKVSVGVGVLSDVFDDDYCSRLANRIWKRRILWTQEQIAFLPAGTCILDVGAGTCYYRPNCGHCKYISLDFTQTTNLSYGKIDIISNINSISIKAESFDAVLCTEVLEYLPDPVGALREIVRLLRVGGKLILTAPLGNGLHQLPYNFYGGFTRIFYEQYLPAMGFKIISIEANGGLYGHLVEMNSERAFPDIETALSSGYRRLIKPFVRIMLRNLPAVLYSKLEDRRMFEAFTVGYHVIAEKEEPKDLAD